MPASTDIKFYVHTNSNSPQLTNNYGCMIDVLDACLVNGFGAQSVSTLKATGKVVTVTFGNAHNLMQYQVIKIVGANQSEFNGEHRILSVPNATSFTYEIANTASVAQATGTIVCSLPPLGWEKPFSSTATTGTGGKAAYRSTNLLLPSRPFLRVVDELDPAYTATYAKYAKVGIVEDMTDINTMLGVQAPYDSENSDKNWVGTGSGASVINGWAKWYYARAYAFTSNQADTSGSITAGSRNWILVGCADYFYIIPCCLAQNTDGISYGFGNYKSILTADTSNTFLSATYQYHAASTSYARGQYTGLMSSAPTVGKIILQRDYTQTALPSEGTTCSLNPSNTIIYSGTQDHVGAVSLNNIAHFTPIFIVNTVLRGELIGLYWLLQKTPYNHLQLIEHKDSTYIAVNVTPNNAVGQCIVKIGDL